MQIYVVWFHPTTLDPIEENNIWMKLGYNSGPLALQAPELTLSSLLKSKTVLLWNKLRASFITVQ